MDDKGDSNRIDDVMMPGFRFHPTDEELVGFYLKRKIQQRSLPIDLIKQVDIYKHDPWDLPKLASSGEKEWYFYCPRERKYRNSARPNRVTGAGFWKATGTDRPIYSSDGTKCIGLKKSLVFYIGRAAKGIKTDWMMHEFRLPTTNNEPAAPPKKLSDKSLPLHDAWAICRIFKKTNSLAQRANSHHNWVTAPFPETPSPDMFYAHYRTENMSCTTETGSTMQLCCNNDHLQQATSNATFSALNFPSCKPQNGLFFRPQFSTNPDGDLPPNSFMFSDISGQVNKGAMDVSSMLLSFPPNLLGDLNNKNSESIDFDGSQQHNINSFSMSSSPEMKEGISNENDDSAGGRLRKATEDEENQWGQMRSMGFPFSLHDLPWDSPNSSEISTTYSNKCYT